MATANSIKRWYFVHKWSSLTCTLFLFILCLTGLPLIFGEDLHDLLGSNPSYINLPASTPPLSLDAIVDAAKTRYPGQIITSISLDDDEPAVLVGMAPSWKASMETPGSAHWAKFDSRTGKIVEESGTSASAIDSFNQFIDELHIDLFAGLPGMIFLGFMGILFVLATVSGVVLYGPFMKKTLFGTIRHGKSRRLRWLDVHNLLGIVTVVWTLVMGATGALNEFAKPLLNHWQRTYVSAAFQEVSGGQEQDQSRSSSLQAVVETVRHALPNTTVFAVLYPGNRFSGPGHYFVLTKGGTPVTSRLLYPVLVDARSGELTAVVKMPWYLRTLEVSRPLHFGDYGGLPLKILWALLDLITIVVLASGLYLWIARRRLHAERLERLVAAHQAAYGAKAATLTFDVTR